MPRDSELVLGGGLGPFRGGPPAFGRELCLQSFQLLVLRLVFRLPRQVAGVSRRQREGLVGVQLESGLIL